MGRLLITSSLICGSVLLFKMNFLHEQSGMIASALAKTRVRFLRGSLSGLLKERLEGVSPAEEKNSFFHALPPTLSNAALKKDEDMKNAATVEVLEQHVRKWIEVREKRESLQSQLSSSQPKSSANSHEISAQHRNCQPSAKQAVSRILSGPKKQPTPSTKQSPPTRPLPASTNLFCNYCKQAGHTLFHCPTKPARPPRFGPRPFGQQQQQFLHSNANRFASLQRRNNGAARRAYS